MLFFQMLLLGGYAYAHLISSKLRPSRQALVHVAMLAISLPFLSIAPGAHWKPTADDAPTLHIVLLLTAHIGLPFAVLSATSPLLTRWFSTRWPDANPYRLYALSNFGSLLALLSYPFLVEPALRLGTQVRFWSGGFGLFVLVCTLCAWGIRRADRGSVEETTEEDGDRGPTLLWLALAATGSVLLISTTSRISQDVAVAPFMWVLPLAVYLVSFIITFDHPRWYRRAVFIPLLGIAYGVVALFVHFRDDFGYDKQIAIYLMALFAGTMVCHGELVRSRPAPRYLTHFYLMVSAGGALGGLAVAVVAPRIFPDYWEFPLGMLAALGLAVYCLRRDGRLALATPKLAAAIVIVGVASGLAYDEYNAMDESIETSRTFFGVIRVKTGATSAGETLLMRHGQIDHGSQFVDKSLNHIPTHYYGKHSGIGTLIGEMRKIASKQRRGLRIGVVGLGAGTLCSYGRRGDTFRIYEIDGEVERLARKHFSYIADCEANVKVALGDARIVLEREALKGSQKFDILALDAFTGDAVPTHLLTRQAIALYRQHLSPGGVLAIHATNAYIDLIAVSRGVTEQAGLRTIGVMHQGDSRYDGSASDWVLATDNAAILGSPELYIAATPWKKTDRAPIVWTDDFASILGAMPASGLAGKWSTAPNGGKFVADLARVVEYGDRKRMQAASRTLFALTDGRHAIVAITITSMANKKRREESLQSLGARMYRSAGLGRRIWNKSLPDADILVVVVEKERKIHVQVGKDVHTVLRPSIEKILNATLGQGVSGGLTSRALRDCVEQLSQLVLRGSRSAN